MSGVLRGFAPAAYEEAVCGVRSVRLNENPCPPSRTLRRGRRACAALLIRREALLGNIIPHL
jgi:hypothetical protein